MRSSRFQNNLRFALRKEAFEMRQSLPLNQIEKIGNRLCWFAYDFKDFTVNTVCDPRFVTVLFTAIAMILNALLFYPNDTWRILSDTFIWIVDNVNWSYVRFGLWILSEVTIFGVGMRAFGRFTNQQLLKHYHEQGMVV